MVSEVLLVDRSGRNCVSEYVNNEISLGKSSGDFTLLCGTHGAGITVKSVLHGGTFSSFLVSHVNCNVIVAHSYAGPPSLSASERKASSRRGSEADDKEKETKTSVPTSQVKVPPRKSSTEHNAQTAETYSSRGNRD